MKYICTSLVFRDLCDVCLVEQNQASLTWVHHLFRSYLFIALLTVTTVFFNRGKMSQNGQEPVKQSGAGLTDAEGKKKYKQHYSGTPCL